MLFVYQIAKSKLYFFCENVAQIQPYDRLATCPGVTPPLAQLLLDMGTNNPCDRERKTRIKIMGGWIVLILEILSQTVNI